MCLLTQKFDEICRPVRPKKFQAIQYRYEENTVPGSKTEKVCGTEIHSQKLRHAYSSQDTIRIIKSRMKRWAEYVAWDKTEMNNPTCSYSGDVPEF
jgi:hypothetical protein